MEIQLTLTINEAQIVLQSLAKMPFEAVADTWFKVKNQAEQQVAAQQAADQPAEAPKAGGTD